MRRPDHAQSDAVPRSAAGELIHLAFSLYFENGALDVLPAQRTADRHTELLSGYAVGGQTDEAQMRDATRRVVRGDAHVAEHPSRESRCAKRIQEVGGSQLGGPGRRAAARVVAMRRQIRRIVGSGPHRGWDLGAPAAGGAVEHGGDRRVVNEEDAPGGCERRALARRGRGPQHLTMGLVAEVEPVGMMTSAICQRERAHRDRQRFERGWRTVAGRFTSQHARDVRLERQRGDRVSPTRFENADA